GIRASLVRLENDESWLFWNSVEDETPKFIRLHYTDYLAQLETVLTAIQPPESEIIWDINAPAHPPVTLTALFFFLERNGLLTHPVTSVLKRSDLTGVGKAFCLGRFRKQKTTLQGETRTIGYEAPAPRWLAAKKKSHVSPPDLRDLNNWLHALREGRYP
ncbi:MAG: hypothetical protein LBS89_05625, partial [Zoogloeaceae bacterium]|nr:hypothetical protein [Zoogloeaceae bacterium]